MPQEKNKPRQSQIQRKLMDEGLKLIASHGMYGCKVEDITTAANVGKGTFFNYFGTKDLFIARLVENTLNDLARRLTPLGHSSQPAGQFLSNLGGVYLRYFQLRPEVAALLVQAPSLPVDSEAGQKIQKSMNSHLDMIGQLLAPYSRELGWEQNVRELALSLLSLSCGFFWLGHGLVNPPGQLLERLGRIMAYGLVQPGGTR